MHYFQELYPKLTSRWETREEVSERELEETHRTHIARCLEELERQAAEEFLQQDSQVDQLMSEHTTAVPLTSLSQPTPEREANLEENMMTHSKVNSILMGEGVEGLMSEVQREREKYPSLLEENRLLEKTQMRMTELTISPGPPPSSTNTPRPLSPPPAPSPLSVAVLSPGRRERAEDTVKLCSLKPNRCSKLPRWRTKVGVSVLDSREPCIV